jgi:hypothetical protein
VGPGVCLGRLLSSSAVADNQETPSTIASDNKTTEMDMRAELRQGERQTEACTLP